jgi:hypothetical protein
LIIPIKYNLVPFFNKKHKKESHMNLGFTALGRMTSISHAEILRPKGNGSPVQKATHTRTQLTELSIQKRDQLDGSGAQGTTTFPTTQPFFVIKDTMLAFEELETEDTSKLLWVVDAMSGEPFSNGAAGVMAVAGIDPFELRLGETTHPWIFPLEHSYG